MESDLLLDTTTEVVVQKVRASSSPSSSSDSVLLKFPHITTHTATLDDSSRQPKNSVSGVGSLGVWLTGL